MSDGRRSSKTRNRPTEARSATGEAGSLLSALYGTTRALQLYPAENEAVRRQLMDVQAAAEAIFEREGGLSVWLAGDFVFVNDLRMRLNLADYATFSALRELLRTHGVGRLDVAPQVQREEWASFLGLLGEEPPEGEPPLDHVHRRMESEGVVHLEIGPPAPLFTMEGGQESLEAARQTYAQSVRAVRDMMTGFVVGKPIRARRARRAVLGIVDQVLHDRASMLGMTTLREYDDHTFLHSVNCSILSVALGESLGFGKEQLFELGFCALFHDIGKLLVPSSVLNKRGWLNDEEWRTMSQHPDFGLLLLFQVQGIDPPPYRAMLTSYEHHMKTDLSGYPRSIRSRRQGLFARIVAVAEAFDAAVSQRSGQYIPCPPDEAIRQLRDSTTSGFDRVVVKAFVNMMGMYPVGTLVILDTGEMAVVIAPNPDSHRIHLPVIRIIADADGTRVGDGAVVDLSHAPGEGEPRRRIVQTTDPDRYGITVSDYVA